MRTRGRILFPRRCAPQRPRAARYSAVALVGHIEGSLEIVGEIRETIAEERPAHGEDRAVRNQHAAELAFPELDARLVAPVEIFAFAHRRGVIGILELAHHAADRCIIEARKQSHDRVTREQRVRVGKNDDIVVDAAHDVIERRVLTLAQRESCTWTPWSSYSRAMETVRSLEPSDATMIVRGPTRSSARLFSIFWRMTLSSLKAEMIRQTEGVWECWTGASR
jgi:hypothetical protein